MMLSLATMAYAQAETSKGISNTPATAQPSGGQVIQATIGNESGGNVTGPQGVTSVAPSGSSKGPLAAGGDSNVSEGGAVGSATSSVQPLTPEKAAPLPDFPETALQGQQGLQVSGAGEGTANKGKASAESGNEVNGASPSSSDSGQKDKTVSQKLGEPAPMQEQQGKKEPVSIIAKFTRFFKRLLGRG